jgi:hypothetical protein
MFDVVFHLVLLVGAMNCAPTTDGEVHFHLAFTDGRNELRPTG